MRVEMAGGNTISQPNSKYVVFLLHIIIHVVRNSFLVISYTMFFSLCREAEKYVSTFLVCLESDNPDIVSTALNNLGEFTALCHGESNILLCLLSL